MKKLFAFLIAFHLMVIPMKAHAIGGMSQITGIAVASVGVTLALSCKITTPSMLLYMAGAAAYLMGEMAEAQAHKKKTDDANKEADDLKNSGIRGGELQKASIEAQLKQKEEDLKLAKKRQTYATAATVAFIAAAAVSSVEFLPFIPIPVCMSLGPGSVAAMAAGAGIVGAYSYIGGGNLKGALLGAVGGVIAVQQFAVDAFNNNVTRSVAMGAAAALVALAAADAGSAAGKLAGEIEGLKKVLAQLKAETDGKGPNTEDTTAGASGGATGGTDFVASGGASSGVTSGAGNGSPITKLPNVTQTNTSTKNCLSANQVIGTDCSNPMKFTAPNLSGLGNGPELQQVANQSAQFGNAAASGDAGKADVAAASLASQASRMNEILKKNRDASNKKLIAEGKKPVDYAKAEQDLLKSMQSGYAKETAAKQSQLAAFGLDKMNGLDPAKADASGQNILGASTEAVAAVPTSKGDAAAAVPELPTDPNANAAADASKNKNAESATDALGKNLDQYESTENDISKNSDESLWKQVSNRYLLNFDRIFERKKPGEKQPAQ